jgi:hypothetical protein
MTSTQSDPTNAAAPASVAAPGATPRMRGRTPIDRNALVLSVLIPVYNERNTIELILNQVHSPVRETSAERRVEGWQRRFPSVQRTCTHHSSAAHREARDRTAPAASTGNVVIVQTRTEYDPADWPTLLEPTLGPPTRWPASERPASRASALGGNRFQRWETCSRT